MLLVKFAFPLLVLYLRLSSNLPQIQLLSPDLPQFTNLRASVLLLKSQILQTLLLSSHLMNIIDYNNLGESYSIIV
jgi:hypothetical protein